MANPTLKARHLYDFESEGDGFRTLIGAVADGTGIPSIANNVVYWDPNGNAVPIFTPTSGAVNPRMVNSRDYAYFEDGQAVDQQKWNTDIGLEAWGITAPSTALTVGAASGGGAQSFSLSAVATASGGTTVYTGVNLAGILATTFVVISGFVNSANNGTFSVVSSTPTTITVNNPSGVAETDPGSLSTQNSIYPIVSLNGWAPFAHVGGFELPSGNRTFNFGFANATVQPYTNPGFAIDGNLNTHTFGGGDFGSVSSPQYAGVVYTFAAPSSPITNANLSITSAVPDLHSDFSNTNVHDPARSAGIWYSLDGGTTWVQIYNQAIRLQQTDLIALSSTQNIANVQVMAFADANPDMDHQVFEINITGTTTGTGPITLSSGRIYYTTFNNATTGNFSDISPASSSTGAVNGGSIPLSNIPVSGDPQVSDVYVLATADGGDPSILYFVTDLPNGTTTFSDGLAEPTLLLSPVYAFTDSAGNEFGVFDNTPPPVNGQFPTKHLGRIWMAVGSEIQFSKNTAELTTPSGIIAGRYEEDWPSFNVLDISEDAEKVNGLYSNGLVIFIGSDRTIRRIQGDSPSNFSEPEVIFDEVGILNQDVWQTVFLEGTPVGTMWLTPDFRVILSDFNTYRDMGTPIQTTLSSINPLAAQNAWAMFGSQGPYGFYMLAIPTGTNTTPDTICVFDMRLKKWYIWQPTDSVIAGLYYVSLGGTSRIVFTDAGGTQRVFDTTTVLDRQNDPDSNGITTTVQTSWIDLGDPMMRDLINEIETQTSDISTLVTLEGASQDSSSFQNPTQVVVNAPLITNLFGQLKTFTCGAPTKDRFYRITWVATSTGNSLPTDVILGAYSLEVSPLSRI